jgi:hypothetical protein
MVCDDLGNAAAYQNPQKDMTAAGQNTKSLLQSIVEQDSVPDDSPK